VALEAAKTRQAKKTLLASTIKLQATFRGSRDRDTVVELRKTVTSPPTTGTLTDVLVEICHPVVVLPQKTEITSQPSTERLNVTANYVVPKWPPPTVTRTDTPTKTTFNARDLKGTKLSMFVQPHLEEFVCNQHINSKKGGGGGGGGGGGAKPEYTYCLASSHEESINVFNIDRDEPDKCTHRYKCVFLFLKVNGEDILIFGMTFRVFDSNCTTKQNRNCMYIEFLDSVPYYNTECGAGTTECRKLRSAVLLEVINRTIEYHWKRGTNKVFLESSPPGELGVNQNYILLKHPTWQGLIPAAKLLEWYHSCFRRGRDLNMVFFISTFLEVWTFFLYEYILTYAYIYSYTYMYSYQYSCYYSYTYS
jgi:hypothetical protein